MAAPSKNQRIGARVKQKVNHCKSGHVQTWVNYAARGRKNMMLMCECNGFAAVVGKS